MKIVKNKVPEESENKVVSHKISLELELKELMKFLKEDTDQFNLLNQEIKNVSTNIIRLEGAIGLAEKLLKKEKTP